MQRAPVRKLHQMRVVLIVIMLINRQHPVKVAGPLYHRFGKGMPRAARLGLGGEIQLRVRLRPERRAQRHQPRAQGHAARRPLFRRKPGFRPALFPGRCRGPLAQADQQIQRAAEEQAPVQLVIIIEDQRRGDRHK